MPNPTQLTTAASPDDALVVSFMSVAVAAEKAARALDQHMRLDGCDAHSHTTDQLALEAMELSYRLAAIRVMEGRC